MIPNGNRDGLGYEIAMKAEEQGKSKMQRHTKNNNNNNKKSKQKKINPLNMLVNYSELDFHCKSLPNELRYAQLAK